MASAIERECGAREAHAPRLADLVAHPHQIDRAARAARRDPACQLLGVLDPVALEADDEVATPQTPLRLLGAAGDERLRTTRRGALLLPRSRLRALDVDDPSGLVPLLSLAALTVAACGWP